MKGSLTRKAMEYTLGQWPYLVGYCERGDLHISNVLPENAIRPFAVGRKAWLFADSAQGAKASATCYSLLETAKPMTWSHQRISTMCWRRSAMLIAWKNSKPCYPGTSRWSPLQKKWRNTTKASRPI